MTGPREPSAHEISHDIDTLRGRVDSLEREVDQRLDTMDAEVDQRLDKMNAKIDEQMRSSVTRHGEVMTAISQLTKSHELADQRASLNHEVTVTSLKENTKRFDALEASKVDALQKLLDERKESGRHWLRYVVAAAITFMLGVGGWILGHFVR